MMATAITEAAETNRLPRSDSGDASVKGSRGIRRPQGIMHTEDITVVFGRFTQGLAIEIVHIFHRFKLLSYGAFRAHSIICMQKIAA
jgi:hypothetical protein